MKATPKSCSCRACKRGKGRPGRKFSMKLDERAFRHRMRIAIDQGGEMAVPAPKGNYYD